MARIQHAMGQGGRVAVGKVGVMGCDRARRWGEGGMPMIGAPTCHAVGLGTSHTARGLWRALSPATRPKPAYEPHFGGRLSVGKLPTILTQHVALWPSA